MTSGQRLPKGLSPLALFSVTMGGLGLLRPASGSWGSLPPVALALLIVWSGAPWWVLDVSLDSRVRNDCMRQVWKAC